MASIKASSLTRCRFSLAEKVQWECQQHCHFPRFLSPSLSQVEVGKNSHIHTPLLLHVRVYACVLHAARRAIRDSDGGDVEKSGGGIGGASSVESPKREAGPTVGPPSPVRPSARSHSHGPWVAAAAAAAAATVGPASFFCYCSGARRSLPRRRRRRRSRVQRRRGRVAAF